MLRAWVMDEPLTRLTDVLSEQSVRLLSLACGLAVIGLMIESRPARPAIFASATALLALVVLAATVAYLRRTRSRGALRAVEETSATDPTPVIVTEPDGEIVFANPAAARRFQSPMGRSLGQVFSDMFANPAAVVHSLQGRAVAVGGARDDVVVRSGQMRIVVVALSDRHFLWRLEEVAASPVSARSVDTLSVPVLFAAGSGTILFMNEAMRRMVGIRVKHLNNVVNDPPFQSDSIQQIAGLGGPIWCRAVEMEAEAGHREIFFLPVGRTERAVPGADGLEDLPVGLLRLRTDGTIQAANRLARDLIAPDGVEVIGTSMVDRVEGLGRPVRDWLGDAVRGRGLGKPEVLRLKSEEVESYLQITLDRVSEAGDVSLVAVLSDATKLKSLEAQFVQSQKMQAIGQLAGGVAHDFNNLLTAISGHCDLMLLRHDQGDPDYADLVQIHQNANRAASLVGQLLAFSRKQTLQPQVIDLRDTLADLTHLLNRLVGERIALTLNHAPGLPAIRADRRQLEQVMMNLVVNARDAMPAGGEIKIETMERVLVEDLKRDRARVPAGRYVVVKVEDRGTGIGPDKLSKIFEPFYTTKRTGEGTGLGLSTAYGIVKQSGGFIFVDSVVGVGTVFPLYFPVHEGTADPMSQTDGFFPAVSWSPGRRRSGGAAPAVAAPALAPEPEADALAGADAALMREVGLVPEPGPDADTAPEPGVPPSAEVAEAEGEDAARTQLPAPSAVSAGAGERAGATDELDLSGSEGVILLVEDEAPVRAFASRALRMRGYTVIEAESAEEALATLADPHLHVDVFVTDVIMPGMDGPTWVREARASRPDVKVVFMSGYAEDHFGDDQARIENSVFLPKPFSLGELTATVQDQLH